MSIKKISIITIVIFATLLVLALSFVVYLSFSTRQSPSSRSQLLLPENRGTLTIDTSLGFEADDEIDLEIIPPSDRSASFSQFGASKLKRKEMPYTIEFYTLTPVTLTIKASYHFKFNDYTIFEATREVFPGKDNKLLIDKIKPVCEHQYCRPLCSTKVARTATKIKGTVVDANTLKPLPWAEIWLSRAEADDDGGKKQWGDSFFCLSDFDGKFELDVEPDAKEYYIFIIRNNYVDYIHTAGAGDIVFRSLNPGETWDVGKIKLKKNSAKQTYKEGLYVLEYNDEAEKSIGLNNLKILRQNVELMGNHLGLVLPLPEIVLKCSESYEIERMGAMLENGMELKCGLPLSAAGYYKTIDGLMKHELVHLYLAKYVLPVWFQEGVAAYEEKALLQKQGKLTGDEKPRECGLKDKSDGSVRDRCIFNYTFTDINHPAEYSSAECFYTALRKGDKTFLSRLLASLDKKQPVISEFGHSEEEIQPENQQGSSLKPTPRQARVPVMESKGFTQYEFIKVLMEASGVSKDEMVSLLTENYGCQDKKAEMLNNL